MKYYISDTHFYHENIIRMCKRPYNNVQEMNEDIIRKWNNKVKPNDEVYFLGDFVYKTSQQNAFAILKQLNGKKYFIRGNHDKESLMMSLRSSGLVEWVSDYQIIDDNNKMVVLFHYPIEDWNGQYHGSYHLYGHVHNNDNNYKKMPRRYNVSVELIGYEPRTLDELIKMNMDKHKANMVEVCDD